MVKLYQVTNSQTSLMAHNSQVSTSGDGGTEVHLKYYLKVNHFTLSLGICLGDTTLPFVTTRSIVGPSPFLLFEMMKKKFYREAGPTHITLCQTLSHFVGPCTKSYMLQTAQFCYIIAQATLALYFYQEWSHIKGWYSIQFEAHQYQNPLSGYQRGQGRPAR